MKIAKDKIYHFIAGCIIAYAAGYFVSCATGVLVSCLLGLISAETGGILKEIYDDHGHGTVDVYDIAATALGGLAGALLAFLTHLFV